MTEKVVYLMRGLPSCGKSTTARKLAGQSGIICETDVYFYTQVGDDPTHFDYRDDLMEEARRWNLERFKKAIDEGISPVIVDRGNSRSLESKVYAQYAIDHGYQVELKEPESEWWQEIRILLKHKRYTRPVLHDWAKRLSELSRQTHRVPASLISDWMDKWKWDLTVQDILDYEGEQETPAPPDATEDAKENMAEDAPRAEVGRLTAEPPSGKDDPPRSEKALLQPGEKSPFL